MGKEPTERLRQASGRFIRKVRTAVSGGQQPHDGSGIRWHVDFPSTTREPWIAANGWVVQGWVVLSEYAGKHNDRVQVVAQWSEAFQLRHPLTLNRPDVIHEVYGKKARHPQLQCGFRFTVPRHLQSFSLAVHLDGVCVAVQQIQMPSQEQITQPPQLKVLEGQNGWLFLDNDTNGSVDQYCGRLQLTKKGVGGWQTYLAGVESIAEQHQANVAVLVAPSKESVMGPRYHPYPEGEGGPIAQLLALPEAALFVYPVPELSTLGDGAFIQTDTHWTQQGAMAATKALATKLGLKPAVVEALFAKDKYRARPVTGDLGNKFDPPRQCQVPILNSFSYSKHRYYDNGLPNFGRLLVLANDAALLPETCLVFGSSSSYSMFHYFCRIFSRVVFVHSAGSLDPELVAAVKPAYLVIQTNARFVVQVPSLNQPLLKTINEKQARLNEEERLLVEKRRLLAKPDDPLLAGLNIEPWLI